MSIKYFKGTFGEMAERCVKGAGTNAERTARIVTLLCELQDFHIKSHDETRAELAKAEARAEKAEARAEKAEARVAGLEKLSEDLHESWRKVNRAKEKAEARVKRAELAKAEARAEKAEARAEKAEARVAGLEKLSEDLHESWRKVNRAKEKAEARVAELEKAIYSALENATDTIWVSEIGTLQDFMGKEQS